MNSFKYISASIWLMIGFALVSCSKDGERVIAPEVVKVTVANVSLDVSVQYLASIDGELIGDTLISGGRQVKVVEHKKAEQRFVVKDANTGEIVIDTLMLLPEKNVTLHILKLNPDSRPSLYLAGNEDIGENEKLWSFYYTDPLLPEAVDVTMYRVRQDGVIDTLATFEGIRKGSLFDFKKIDYTYGLSVAMYYYDVRDPVTGDILLNSGFDPLLGAGGLMAYNDFTATHFINDLVVYDLGGGGYFHYSTTILAY